MTTLTATYNGKTFTRKTDRSYQYAVAVTLINPQPMHGGPDGIVSWCGDLAKAKTAAKKYSKPQWGFSRVEIVPTVAA
ncbi:hypothetical protein UFOVP503_18 [uncultured Caudovirales phage]|uniref:Uncharacterized protein n=1 Tax=uncultured Caudovirales phage TaxID=2100421 RepID=A0A6J5MSA0_9CAUD|nr:hypothetical protein UFOVP503_18 [uncultured Caudovirales phage]CAB4160761.1 hypothetical protein UFOVP763_12 [uncultured Caudovirales phage]